MEHGEYQDNSFEPTKENLQNAALQRWGDIPRYKHWETCNMEKFMQHLRKCESALGITWNGKPDPYCPKTRGRICYE